MSPSPPSPPTPPTPPVPIMAARMATNVISFPIMELPRELRDSTYGHMHRENHIDIAIPNQPVCMGLCVVSGPVTSLLRVSRQFSKEYSESITRCAGLIIHGYGMLPNVRIEPTAATTSLRLIKNAAITLSIACTDCIYHRDPFCHTPSRLEDYLSTLSTFAPHFTRLKRAKVNLDMVVRVESPSRFEDEEGSVHHDFDQAIAALDGAVKNSGLPITTMKVTCTTFHHPPSRRVEIGDFGPNRLHSQWTAAKGWQLGGGELKVYGHENRASSSAT